MLAPVRLWRVWRYDRGKPANWLDTCKGAGVGLGGVRFISSIFLFVNSVGVEEPEWWECGRGIGLLVEDERVGQHAAWSDRDVHAFR